MDELAFKREGFVDRTPVLPKSSTSLCSNNMSPYKKAVTQGNLSPKNEGLTSFEKRTKGVQILLGEPKKAIIKLALPIIIAMSVNTVYNLVDAIWVAGLGTDALAAVGFFFPFFYMAIAISVGIGVGAGAAISRRIGAKDKLGADNVAAHTIVIMIVSAIAFSIPLFMTTELIFRAIGAGKTTGIAVSYARVLFGGSIVIFFTMIVTAMLRAEGDAKRTMYAMMLGSALNIGLDPIFIYILDMGVAGAAWATLFSMSVTSIILFYWLFIKKDTYISITFKKFHFKREILVDIFRVGLPATLMQASMAFMMLLMTIIIVNVEGTDGVAVFTTGWRVVMIAILPLLGIATAVVSVTGAAYGEKDIQKLDDGFKYAIKIGVIIATIIAILTFILAPYIALIFTYSEGTTHIYGDIVVFLQITCLFYPGVPIGMFSSSMFQGTGKGINSLIFESIRSLILSPPLAIIYAFLFNWGLMGVWLGIVTANLIGSMIGFLWARLYISKLRYSKKLD